MSATAAPERRRVAILGIDNLSRKNRVQLSALNARGYFFDVFTRDALGDSVSNAPAGNTLHVLEPRALARAAQVRRYLQQHRGELHHVEVYPAGRFAALYVLLARRAGVRVMTVERGDLLYRSRYDRVTRLSMDFCYRQADVVWYREPYQDRLLASIGARRRFFLHNAVTLPDAVPDGQRSVDFAWVNRLIVERRADWVAEILSEPEFSRASAVMYGFMQPASGAVRRRQAEVVARNLENLTTAPYGDPTSAYVRARFFLLPSEVVFCNNALLEAMAHGVVPLVSDVEGARRIVDHEVNGFVFPHDLAGLRNAMRRALALDPGERVRMSRAAVEKVQRDFSVEAWGHTLEAQYRRLSP